MELNPGDYVLNFGVGVPESVATVMNYENINQYFISTIEPGIIGGIAQSGTAFGSSKFPEAIVDEPYQFDFYDGGGIDCTFLGLAECDAKGSINVSRFGSDSPGCGGFINISQSAKKVVFCGSFTAKGLEVKAEGRKLKIVKEGAQKKFVRDLGHLTFNGEFEAKKGKEVLYLTERAVFELTEKGLLLTEIAPGMDLDKDILAQMEFKPLISENLKTMDERIFSSDSLDLEKKIGGKQA
jgi:propionate CoA-transferase